MSSVFRNKMPIEKPNRNTFDLSFANNLTMKFGALYPVMCKEVIPGDSFNISADFGLRFMPMVFPVQTRMKAYLHFFYVRNRNLWTDWKKFITATGSDLVFPYIDANSTNGKKLFVTGSLGDYLGLPTTIVAGSGSSGNISTLTEITPASLGLNLLKTSSLLTLSTFIWKNVYFSDTAWSSGSGSASVVPLRSENSRTFWNTTGTSDFGSSQTAGNYNVTSQQKPTLDSLASSWFKQSPNDVISVMFKDNLANYNIVSGTKFIVSGFSGSGVVRLSFWVKSRKSSEFIYFSSTDSQSINSTSSTTVEFELQDNFINIAKTYAGMCGINVNNVEVYASFDVLNNALFMQSFSNESAVIAAFGERSLVALLPSVVGSMSNLGFASNSATSINSISKTYQSLNISALPFRAYQAIYNSFYRNILNDPLIINGTAEYDKFILNDKGGADSTLYELYYKNWEDDFLTMSVPSPQQGVAPLLGMSYGNSSLNGSILRITHDSSLDNASSRSHLLLNVDSSNKVTFTAVNSSTTNNGLIQGFIDILQNASSFGISINDLRNVNSLQRWLEKNSARGFRYKEQIMSHFGVDLTFELCDMPEFIGGFSRDVNITTVTQTSEGDSPLGSYAGQGYCIGSSNHSINHYFDEHGFVMAILSVVPVPSYSQLLPKMFLKNNHLDYFTPEFAHIGYQPVQYKEVCPLQANSENISLNKVFGYQRPWYDYLASVDEVHSGFRNDDLKSFLVNRTFAKTPELSSGFLHVNPDEVNDIFAVTTDNDDKILGQIYFDIKAKRPIPEFINPSIQ